MIQVNTDGACSGNPGEAGIGVYISFSKKEDKEIPIKDILISENIGYCTNNVAEYMAIIRGLEEICKLNLENENILILSDSQLAIYQIIGEYRVKNEQMQILNNSVIALAEKLRKNNKIKFQWISRDQNKKADALASSAINQNSAIIEGNTILFYEKDISFIPDLEKIEELATPSNKTQISILKLNRTENPKFKDFMELKTAGKDTYSSMKLDCLIETAEIRFGKKTLIWLEKTTNGFGNDYGKKVLRWVARGLNPELALKKVSVDIEVSNNIVNKQ